MAITQNTFTGNGSNLGPFSFTFKWLEPTDIKVTVAGTLKTAGTHYNLQSLNYSTKTGGQVLFTAGNTPANNAAIVIYRQTDDSDLVATFYSGSAIRSQDLNNNFVQGLYVTQEANNNVITANTTANAANATANTALSNSTAAVSTANTASSNASAAVATANTASSNASAAVSTANTASSNATAAVNTANTASSNASTALSTANTALSTANTASSNASAAVATANTASSNASAAVSTANTASSNATTAVNTANNALSTANAASATANTASTNASAALNAVAGSLQYTLVANVAGIPGSPVNNQAIEIADSTGIESFSPLTNRPAGFVGDSGLSVRLQYLSAGSSWNWLNYFANNSETRYLKFGGGTITGNLEIGNSGSLTFEGSTANAFETTLAVTDPTADRTITLPDVSGTVVTTGDTGSVTSTMIADGTIADADINASAAISLSKLATGALPTAITVASSNIVDGTIVNADVSASAAIAGTKISPDFGAQNVTTTGTSTAASFIPTSSTVPTNGVYLPAANSVAISTGGSGRLFVDASGRVGIATSSPSTVAERLLHVYGSAGLSGGIRVTGNNGTGIDLIQAADGNGYLYQRDNAFLAVGTNNAERLRITSAGLVGIGTSAPGATLDVAPDANRNLQVQGKSGTTYGLEIKNGTANSAGEFHVTAASSGAVVVNRGTTEIARFNSTGLGIGTTTVDDILHLKKAGDLYLRVENSSTNVIAYFGQNSSGTYIGNGATGSDIRFLPAGTERCRLTASGQLLVGTSSAPGAGDGQYGKVVIQGYTGDNTAQAYLSLQRGEIATSVSSGEEIGTIGFNSSDGYPFAKINCFADGAVSAGDYPGRLVFSVTRDGSASPTEAMRISNTGAVTHSCNIADWGLETKNQNNSSSNYGISILCGTNAATGTNYAVNISSANGTNQGYITFTGGTVTYGAFTAHHPCILPDADNETGYPYGTLLEIINIEYTQEDGRDTERGILYNVRKAQAANSRAILGAYGSSMNGGPGGETNRHQALVLGDGHILCNNSGGNIKVGDGICSSATPGIGQKAIATPSMAIGIAQEDVTFADDEEVKLVAVQYGLRQFIPWGD